MGACAVGGPRKQPSNPAEASESAPPPRGPEARMPQVKTYVFGMTDRKGEPMDPKWSRQHLPCSPCQEPEVRSLVDARKAYGIRDKLNYLENHVSSWNGTRGFVRQESKPPASPQFVDFHVTGEAQFPSRLPSCGETVMHRTPLGSGESITLDLIGDSGISGEGMPWVAQAMAQADQQNPVHGRIHLGDMAYPQGFSGPDDPRIQELMVKPFALSGNRPLICVLGNHARGHIPSTEEEAAFFGDESALATFAARHPETNIYAHSCAAHTWIGHDPNPETTLPPLRIDQFLIDSSVFMAHPTQRSLLGRWVHQSKAAGSNERWLLSHHPLSSIGKQHTPEGLSHLPHLLSRRGLLGPGPRHGPILVREARAGLEPQKPGFTAVLSGHVHSQEVFQVGDTTQITTGAAHDGSYAPPIQRIPKTAAAESIAPWAGNGQPGWMRLSVGRGGKKTLTVYQLVPNTWSKDRPPTPGDVIQVETHTIDLSRKLRQLPNFLCLYDPSTPRLDLGRQRRLPKHRQPGPALAS